MGYHSGGSCYEFLVMLFRIIVVPHPEFVIIISFLYPLLSEFSLFSMF